MPGKQHKTNTTSKQEEEDDIDVQEKPAKNNSLFLIFNLGTFPLFVVGALFLMKVILEKDFRTCDCKFSKQIAQFYPKTWDLQNKLEMIFLAWIHPGIIILVLIVLIMTTRLLGQYNPLRQNQEPLWIITLNRIIQNTMEQSFIFLGFYSYWVIKVSTEENKDLSLKFIVMFFVGRLIFTVGYLFQWITNFIGGRAGGFAMTIFTNFCLLSAIFGCDLTSKIVKLMTF